MKTLILMRHAKSSWDGGDLADHDRPLSSRGRDAAPKMGAWLRKMRLRPDQILCSTATRVRETLDLLRPTLPPDLPIQESKRLYMALPREILSEIARMPASIDTLMVIGHNPGIGSLAHWLVGQGDNRDLALLTEKFPTAAVAVLDFEVDSWRDIDGEAGTLRHFATPKGGD
jgi:phosphohistidine phosphatase